ncbi:MAG: SRPBCC family protein [Nitrospirota bacterium]
MQALTASIQLPVSPETAFRVISDLNTLLRLSPFFTLTQFASTEQGPPKQGTSYTVTLDYYATRRIETHNIRVDAFEPNKAISFAIGDGALKSISCDIERSGGGITLTQTLMLDAADGTVMAGSQNELHLWMRSVGEYLKLAEGRSLLKRLLLRFMDRIWLKLTLSERNIAIIITKISILEIALLLIVVVLWNLAMR